MTIGLKCAGGSTIFCWGAAQKTLTDRLTTEQSIRGADLWPVQPVRAQFPAGVSGAPGWLGKPPARDLLVRRNVRSCRAGWQFHSEGQQHFLIRRRYT